MCSGLTSFANLRAPRKHAAELETNCHVNGCLKARRARTTTTPSMADHPPREGAPYPNTTCAKG
eukprot:4575404-Alexandrium_andersonii.AAC.1